MRLKQVLCLVLLNLEGLHLIVLAQWRDLALMGFLGQLSQDAFGQLLSTTLKNDGVTLLNERLVQNPTALAVISTDASGHPAYTFHRTGTGRSSV